MTLYEEIPVVTRPSKKQLTDRQLTDYQLHRETVIEWLLTFGKNPERANGYSKATVKRTAYRLDAFYRWVWDRDGYTTISVTHKLTANGAVVS